MNVAGGRQELAYYATDWIWPSHNLDRMKSLLLFFDGIAMTLPEQHFQSAVDREPILAQPLLERGLLHNLKPEKWLTKDVAVGLRGLVGRLLSDRSLAMGRYDMDSRLTLTFGHFISSAEDSSRILDELRAQGVIAGYGADDIVTLPAYNRAAILTALAVALQASISDFSIQPVIRSSYPEDRSSPVAAFWGAITEAGMPPAAAAVTPQSGWEDWNWQFDPYQAARRYLDANVFELDFQSVGVNLSGVPLDEVLDFRRMHGASYRAYAQELRGFVADLNIANTVERERMLRLRAESLNDRAAELRSAGRSFVRPVGAAALSIAGAAWTLRQGDPMGAVLAIGAAIAGFSSPNRSISPYTYVFETRQLDR